MGFFKKTEVKDARAKYGFSHQGVFASEPIAKGDSIWTCDPAKCDYLQLVDVVAGARTRAETLAIMAAHPASAEFIQKYMYMVDDDKYDWPCHFAEQRITEECMYFNHSCDPNCGFATLDSGLVVAIRDIEVGEELTYDYQFMDTEASFYGGLNCKCGSFKCRGVLHFDQYRNVDWQNAYYKYSGCYIKKRIDELTTKWFSSRCYLKTYNVKRSTSESAQTELGLTALRKIRKDDLVAKFVDMASIKPSAHYLRHESMTPTCKLIDNEVFAIADIEPETELTVNYESTDTTESKCLIA